MVDDDAFDRIVAAWNRAAIDPTRWNEAVSAAAGALGASSAALFTPTVDPDGRFLTAAHGSASEALPVYAAHWVAEDPWFATMAQQHIHQGAGNTSVGRSIVETSTLRRTGFYHDFAKVHGIHEVMSLVVCDEADAAAPVTRLSFFRTDGVAEFEAEERRVLGALWPHLQRAIQSYWLLRKARDHDRIAEQTLDAVPHPAWVLRADATIDHANAAARSLQPGWVGTVNRRLQRIGQLDAACLGPALRGEPGAVLAVPRVAACLVDGRLRKAGLHLVPLREHPACAAAWPHASTLLVLDLAPRPPGAEWLQRFARHHRLTRAETGVLALLVEGHDVPSVADRLHIAYSTARTHVRLLFEKTGCRRQADLVRMFFEP